MFKLTVVKKANKLGLDFGKKITVDGNSEVSVIVERVAIGNIIIESGTGEDADLIKISVAADQTEEKFEGTIKIASAGEKEKPGSSSAGGTPPPVVIVEPED